VFHVEPVAVWQAGEDWIGRVQRGEKQLCRQADDLSQQSFQVARIKLCRRIIHKQGGHTGTQFRVASELTQQQCRGGQFLLPTGHPISCRDIVESNPQVGPVRTAVRQATLPISYPGCLDRLSKASLGRPTLKQRDLEATLEQALSGGGDMWSQ